MLDTVAPSPARAGGARGRASHPLRDHCRWFAAGACRARGARPETQAARPFAFDLTDDARADLRWYLEEYLDLPDHGSRVRAEGVQGRIERWGRALHDALFGDGAYAERDAPLAVEQHGSGLKARSSASTTTA